MFTNRRSCVLLALVAAAGSASSARAQTAATWTGLGNGTSWDDPLNWSTPNYPDKDNPLGTTYNAFLLALGSPYTVTLNRPITLTDLNIGHADATLDLTDFNMTLERDLNMAGGLLLGTGGGGTGEIRIAGLTSISSSKIMGVSRVSALGGTTLSDGMIDDIPQYVSQGVFTFQGSTQDEICDTGIGHGGTAVMWTGTGDIMFAGSSSFQHGASSTFTITSDRRMYWDGMGTQATFTNDGVIVKSTGTGTTFFEDIDLTITSAGTLRVETGTFHTNQLTNIAGGSLNAGTFEINSVLQADGADVTGLGTKFTLDGPGAQFVDETGTNSGFRNLANINAAGDLTLMNGPDLTVSGGLALNGDGKFTGDTGVAFATGAGGNLAITGTSQFTIKGAGSTVNAGGDVTVGSSGSFTADTGAVVTQAATRQVTVQNAGVLTVQGAGTSFASGAGGSVTINDTSSIAVRSSGQFTAGGNTQVNGTVTVNGSGSQFSVAPGSSLLNVTGGAITGGTFDIDNGVLIADNVNVNNVGSKITLTGAAAEFRDRTSGLSGIRNLNTIASTGDLTFATGQTFNAVGGLSINAGGKLSANAAGTQINTNGDVTVSGNGQLNVGAGATVQIAPTFTVTNFAGGVFTDGVFNVAGTLRFNPDQPVTAVAGDVTFGSVGAGIVDHGGGGVFAPVDTVRPAGRFALERGFQFATQGSLQSLGRIKVGLPSADVDTILTVNGDLNQDDGTITMEEGRLVVTGTYTIAAGAVLDGIGTVEGTINSHGTISPGITIVPPGPDNSAGILSVLGDFRSVIVGGETDELLLKMQVGGTIAGELHDQLMISGLLNLADGSPDGSGVVELSLLAGYTPVDGDTYVLVTFGARLGHFAELRAPQPPGGGRFDFYYTEHSLNAVYTIPAPASLAFLSLAGLGASRRRR